jgi:hypothetical protein
LLEGGLASQATQGVGSGIHPGSRNMGAAVHAQAINTFFDAQQRCVNRQQLCGFMFVDGKSDVSTV